MEKILSSCNFEIKSHPDKSLLEHLSNVQKLILNELKSKKLNLKHFKQDELNILARIIAISHDFGKSTSFFQDYLSGKAKKSDKTNHAYISALFAFHLTQKIGINKKLLSMFIVDRHHSNLKELAQLAQNCTIENFNEDQINSINFSKLLNVYENFFRELKIELNFQEFKSLIKQDSDFCDITIYDSYEEEVVNKADIEDFFLILFLFSLLIDSDKLDAGINDKARLNEIKEKVRSFNFPEAVDNFKKMPNEVLVKDSRINQLRENIYQEAVNSIKNINLDSKIFSLNVPTGTGKTLTGLSSAFKLKERLIKEKGFNPKIIYCLPFTSIIDQNYNVIEKILEQNEIDLTSYNLLKHHHLSDISYKTDSKDDEENFDAAKSLLLIESWQSSIIVTTFVQFFHSLISNRNKSLKKFHNIANSIIILDEVQAVPYYYWLLIRETLKTFSEIFNTYFILVTATQPMIFDESKGEIVEIIKNKKQYFQDESLNRIKLINEFERRSIEDFKTLALNDINKNNPGKSFLIILNTIKSSQEVYKFINDNISTEETEILYLSTTILPFERLEIIKKIKNRKQNNKRIILISTQVVEAGVDIDLDIVYRDLAPLDCIFQSAGRCNRHAGSDEKGIVKVFNLVDCNNKNKAYAGYVYETILLESTKAVLNEKAVFEEREFLDLAEKYYKKVSIVKSDDKSKKILSSMRNLDFSGLKEFKLIKDLESFDFFIELNDEAKEELIKYENILLNNDYENKFERKYDLLENRKNFHKYIVSVRLKKNDIEWFEQEPFNKYGGEPYYIPFDEVVRFYEENGIGFNLNEFIKIESEGLII